MLSNLLVRSLHIYSMMQPSSEAQRVSQALQVDFDRILSNVLKKYYFFPGFTLLLGSLLQSVSNTKRRAIFPPGMVASLYLVRRRGEGYILDDIGLSGIDGNDSFSGNTPGFLTYLTQLLEHPERFRYLHFRSAAIYGRC